MTRFLAPLLALCVLIGAAWGFAAFQPCSAPAQKARALGLPVGATSCPATIASAAAAETPPEPPPPAVTVATANRREFVDRLFVSGTLVPRDEAEVAARIDGLTIVELDAEDGDWVKAGQVLARLDRTQLDALLAENDAAIKSGRRCDRAGEKQHRPGGCAGEMDERRLRARPEACGRRDVRFDRRAARDGAEDG